MSEDDPVLLPSNSRRLVVEFRSWPRLCENSTRYKRTRNFEACGHAQGKKMQKFLLRSALQPNQISFSHGLGPSRHFVADRQFRRFRAEADIGPDFASRRLSIAARPAPSSSRRGLRPTLRSFGVACWTCIYCEKCLCRAT